MFTIAWQEWKQIFLKMAIFKPTYTLEEYSTITKMCF